MKIVVIQASSQSDKNKTLYRCTCDAIKKNSRKDDVVNFGTFPGEKRTFSYIETALNISLLLASGAADFVVTGCSSGQGMMLACNSLPAVLCGFIQTPQDAYLFGRINDGNAVSLPLGLNYGWLGEINLQCTLDKLFEGEFGIGYPPEAAERKRRDTAILKQINSIAKRSMTEVYSRLDEKLVHRAMQWDAVKKFIVQYGQNDEIITIVKSMN